MKKQLLFAAMLIVAGSSYAQSIIPKAGASLSYFTNTDAQSDSKFGFIVGVGFNLPLGEGAFSIQPELNFIQKGDKAEQDGTSEKLTLNYIELPVLVKASFGGASKFLVLVVSIRFKTALQSLTLK